MEEKLFERIRESLGERRENLAKWLDSAPSRKKRVLLGPATEEAVQAHLHTIDTALEKAASETLGQCEVCDGFVGADLLQAAVTAVAAGVPGVQAPIGPELGRGGGGRLRLVFGGRGFEAGDAPFELIEGRFGQSLPEIDPAAGLQKQRQLRRAGAAGQQYGDYRQMVVDRPQQQGGDLFALPRALAVGADQRKSGARFA